MDKFYYVLVNTSALANKPPLPLQVASPKPQTRSTHLPLSVRHLRLLCIYFKCHPPVSCMLRSLDRVLLRNEIKNQTFVCICSGTKAGQENCSPEHNLLGCDSCFKIHFSEKQGGTITLSCTTSTGK